MHVKKAVPDYKNIFRPEGMKNCTFGSFITCTLFIKFQTMHISEITIL